MDQEQAFLQQLKTGTILSDRIIFITGEVDNSLSTRIIMALKVLDATNGDIQIYINSPGGSETDGYAIYDAVCQCRNRVIMEGCGAVHSIAAAIFMSADIRRMTENSTLMIHNGFIHTNGEEVGQNEIIATAEQIKKNNQRYHSILANASNVSYSDIEKACMTDSHYNADECLKLGFCDEIIAPIKKKSKKKNKKK